MSDPFADFTTDDIRALIAQHPLAWVCSVGDAPSEAAQLPLIGEYDEDGRLLSLIGHLGRANPLYDRLRAQGRALLLFSGPSAYVSPEHAGLRDWAPTWIYANLRITAEVTVDAALTDEALDVLIGAMEHGRQAPWTRAEIAHRYHGMASAIIGFRAWVTGIAGRFKFGQDERDAVYRTIAERLAEPAVTPWLRRFNPDR
ncbi:negative transcriptional regulator, PaiB family [Sphingomonas gellani]|uniref:Negative transcriptional regulator, PaiB family n=1 Tax=Sphingomonas gellani TaxID=1166340 RepID=A0A1H8AW54_9SPHN|nr:FMN-binding negative transcriptional regulator [Sphingomonas gellani]SEM74028.1 negative transcriptional regulator, PaiB family [Sphingomonas gellani]